MTSAADTNGKIPVKNGPDLNGLRQNEPGLNEHTLSGTAPYGTGPHGPGPNGPCPHGPGSHGLGPYGNDPYRPCPHGTGFFGTFGSWVTRSVSVSYIVLLYIGVMCLFISILLTYVTFDPPGKNL